MVKATSKPASSKKSVKNEKKLMKESKYIEYTFLVILSAFMIIIPFYRGLFFRENYMPAISFVSLLYLAFLVYKLINKDYKVLNTYLDLAVLAIPICYFISFLFGVNAKDGFDAVLIYASYFMIYRIASGLSSKNEKIRSTLINVIILSTFVTAFTSILVLAKVIYLNGVVVYDRLYGLYQYANTTASVLGIGIVLAINTLMRAEDIKVKLIYQIVLTTLLSTFIFTLSRGAFLAIAVVLLLYFLVVDGQGKLKLVLNLMISFLSNLMFIFKYYTEGQAEYNNIMTEYILSIVIALVLTSILHLLYKKFLKNISNKAVNIAFTFVVLIFAGFMVFILSAKEPIEYKIEHLTGEEKSWKNTTIYMENINKSKDYSLEFDVKSSLENPNSYGVIIRSYNEKEEFEEIYKEFNSVGNDFEHKKIEFTTLNDTYRLALLFYNYETDSYTIYTNIVLKDDMGNIIKKQDRFKYLPDTIANRFTNIKLDDNNASSRIQFIKDGIKVFKDNIIIGAGGGGWKNLYRQYQSRPYNTTEVHNFYVQYAIEVGLLGLIPLVVILVQLLIGCIKAINNRSNYLSIYLAVLLMFMHSSIDFNLSLVAVAYILWLLIGILNTDSSLKQIIPKCEKWNHIALAVLSLLIFTFSSTRVYAINIGKEASKIINKDINRSIELYEKAIKYDKYNGAYRIDYAQIMSKKLDEEKDKKYYNEVMNQIGKVTEYEPYNAVYTPKIINLMLSCGHIDEAVSMANIKVSKEPMLSEWYNQKIEVNYQIAKYLIENDQVDNSITYLKNVLETKQQLEETNSKLAKPIKLSQEYETKIETAISWMEQADRIENRE